MSDLETARAMLTAAERDLGALGHMTDIESFATEVFGFHAQQVVEKCLKAWLSIKGVRYARTHDIRYLIVLLEQQGEDTEDLWDYVNLSAFAVQFRYEAYETIDEPLDREEVVQRTEQLYFQVREALEKAGETE